jgi:hypothetical protein
VGITAVPKALSIEKVISPLNPILYSTIGIGKGEDGQSLGTKVSLP